MPKYNHAFDITFEVISNNEDAADVTPDLLKAALLRRIDLLDAEGGVGWMVACSPYDTHEVQE